MLRRVATAAYTLGIIPFYIYLTVHDWPLVNGWAWVLTDAVNVGRALFWPVYVVLLLVWWGGAIPPDRL
jgi:hypothetical protein